jgi:hypothetical protein
MLFALPPRKTADTDKHSNFSIMIVE